MKQKLLLLYFVLVGFAVNASAYSTAVADQHCSITKFSGHLAYWLYLPYVNDVGKHWDPFWHNTNGYHDQMSKHQDYTTADTYNRQFEKGRGYVVATEWDNPDKKYATQLGHTYLISYVQSKGYDYCDENAEGYARLVARAFHGTSDSPEWVYWMYAWFELRQLALNYGEGKSPQGDSQSSRFGEQTDTHKTVAGHWDVTNTPSRVTLFKAIEDAYNVRDGYDVSTGTIVFNYPINGDINNWMTAEINKAIKVFKANYDDATEANAKYLAAAENLKNRMDLLKVYETKQKSYYNGEGGNCVLKEINKYKTSTEFAISGTTKTYKADVIPGVEIFLDSLCNRSKYGQTYTFAHSFEMVSSTNYTKAKKIAELTTPEAQAYYDDVIKRSRFKTSKSEDRTKTEAGLDTIAYVNPTTFASYTSKSEGIANIAWDTYKSIIDANNVATVIDTVATKKAADAYADDMQRAEVLYSAEVNAMAMFDYIATFINDTCQSKICYDALNEILKTAQEAVIKAETKEAVDQACETLWAAYLLENGENTQWNKVAHDKAQVYYTDVVNTPHHLSYGAYNENTWYWHKIWRNNDYANLHNYDNHNKTPHGAIVATEWDNEEGHYNTQNGHKYLISWVWSNGKDAAYDFKSKNYEGYARLLSRRFNESDNTVGDFVSAFWGNDIAYSEYNSNPYKNRISGTQRSYQNGNRNITVTGAWDITATPNRDSLFLEIDNAFDTRDAYTGETPPYTFKYPADCRAHQQMDKEIKAAIDVFMKDNQSDDVYKTAAIALKDRMALLVKWHEDSIALLDKNHLFEMKYDDNVNKNPGVDMFAEFVKRALVNEEAPANYTYSLGQSFEILAQEPAALETVTSMSTDRANAFYENQICTGKIFSKQVLSHVLEGTVAGYDTLSYLKNDTYRAYYERAWGLGKAARDEFDTTLAQLYAAPAIDTTAIKNAADKFVEGVVRCASLFSTEVNAMAVLDEVATFVNDSCVNQKAYDNIRAEYIRTEKAILEAETMQALDNQVAILYSVLYKARVNNSIDVVKDNLIDIDNVAYAVFNKNMEWKTPLKNVDYQSTVNLFNALNSADKVIRNTPTVNKSTNLEFNGKYDLYDNSWQTGSRAWAQETPVSRVVREDSTLLHAFELYKAQYDFETVIDSITALHYDIAKYDYPKQVLAEALAEANAVNEQITALTTEFTADGETIKPIEKVALAKKALLDADKIAMDWQEPVVDDQPATGINDVDADATSGMKNGKFLNEKNQVIIVKNGKQYTTAGHAVK